MRRTGRQATMRGAIQQNGSRTGGQVRRADVGRKVERHKEADYDSATPHPSGGADLNGKLPRALRDAFPSVDRTLRSGALIGGAMHGLSQESIELAARALQKHIDAGINIVNSRTTEEFLLAQEDLLRTTLAEASYSMRCMAEIISKMVD